MFKLAQKGLVIVSSAEEKKETDTDVEGVVLQEELLLSAFDNAEWSWIGAKVVKLTDASTTVEGLVTALRIHVMTKRGMPTTLKGKLKEAGFSKIGS